MFRREGQEGWVVDRFNTSVPMSTYQVAFVVSELGYLNCTMQRDVQIRGTVPSLRHLICPYVIFTTSRNLTLQHTVNSCGMCFIYFCTYIPNYILISESFPLDLSAVWARPELLPLTTYAQALVPRLFKFLEDYLGVPYPLPKLDIVTLPSSFPIAFEAWGLILNYE